MQTEENIVGRYMLRPFVHHLMTLRVVVQRRNTQTFEPATSSFVGSTLLDVIKTNRGMETLKLPSYDRLRQSSAVCCPREVAEGVIF